MKFEKEVINYFKKDFFSDLKAGFITAIVALPLAIAFAIASGVPPIMGLYTAIIAGILGSTFGGSKFSVTGPTGAMAVIILSTVTKYGLEGLLLAGFLAGIIQIAFGIIKLGKLVKYIPMPVIVGFTAGIGAIIFIGQISNFLGLSITPKDRIWETLFEIYHTFSNFNHYAVIISIATICLLIFLPYILNKNKLTKNIPPSIIALLIAGTIVFTLGLNIPTIGTIAGGFPKPHLINFNLELLFKVLPSAFTIALLGVIEALLCAVICDAMTNTKHKSDKELIGQGIANLVLPFFNAIPSTAAIARSAVNIREGARTKGAGIIHALVLLTIILFFAQFAKYIPLAFLAGVLIVVSIRMININEIKTILSTDKSEIIVLISTFVLTIFTDLVFAVQIGMLLAISLLFLRLVQIIDIKQMEEYDSNGEINSIILKNNKLKNKVSIYTIHGPFFFGAMNVFQQKINEHMHISRPYIIIRMKHVPFIDGTGLIQLMGFLKERKKNNSKVLFTEFWPGVKEKLFKNKEFQELVSKHEVFPSTNKAIEYIEKLEDAIN